MKPASPYDASSLTWASDLNYSSGDESGLSTKAEPSAGLKAQGHVPGFAFRSAHDNWFKYGVHQWINYLNNIHAETDFTGQDIAWGGSYTLVSRARMQYATAQLHTRGASAVGLVAGRYFSSGDVAVVGNTLPAGPLYLSGQVDSAYLVLPLNSLLRHGAAIDSLALGVKPGAGRSPGSRMAMALYSVNNTTGALTDLTTGGFPAVEDAGSTADQNLTISAATAGDRVTANLMTHTYFAMIKLGSTATAFPDRIYGIQCSSYSLYALDVGQAT
jgi:hypothetical protein